MSEGIVMLAVILRTFLIAWVFLFVWWILSMATTIVVVRFLFWLWDRTWKWAEK